MSTEYAGIVEVNGWYGPGAWAAWIITMASFIGTIYRSPDGYATASLLPPVIYMNWAAIDRLRHFSAPERSLEHLSSSTGVTLWGMWFLWFAQHKLRSCRDGPFAFHVRRMRSMIVIGFVLPCITATMTVIHLYATIWKLKPHTDEPDVPASNIKHQSSSHKSDGFNIALNTAIIFLFYCYAFVQLQTAWELVTPAQRRSSQSATIISTTQGTDLTQEWPPLSHWRVLSLALLLIGNDIPWRVVLQGFAMEHGIDEYQVCVLKPCSLQSIQEWDQAGVLCLGLAVFACQFRKDILGAPKAIFHYMEALMSAETAQPSIRLRLFALCKLVFRWRTAVFLVAMLMPFLVTFLIVYLLEE